MLKSSSLAEQLQYTKAERNAALVAERPLSWGDDARQNAYGMAEWILPPNHRAAHIELALSRRDKTTKHRKGAVPSPRERDFAATGQRSVPLRDELPSAAQAYDAALSAARRIMLSATTGRIEAGQADAAVLGLVQSLERNPDALLLMSRFRQHVADACTHCVNVALLLACYALVGGADRRRAVIFGLAGLMHDAGKALVPVSLLGVKRGLTDEELAEVRRHPMAGCELLAALPEVHGEVLLAALEHHERYDGSGYPRGMSGDAISEAGNVTAVADAYDALCSPRPHREALYPHRALGVLYKARGKAFHPDTVERFVRVAGVYPVGSVVQLKDGHRGVVSASNQDDPIKPCVTVVQEPSGRIMPLIERNLATGEAAGIARCLSPETSGINPRQILGLF